MAKKTHASEMAQKLNEKFLMIVYITRAEGSWHQDKDNRENVQL